MQARFKSTMDLSVARGLAPEAQRTDSDFLRSAFAVLVYCWRTDMGVDFVQPHSHHLPCDAKPGLGYAVGLL